MIVDGHLGRASTNGTGAEALGDCAARARAAAETAALTAAAAPHPGFPAVAPARAHHGHDPETAALDAALGGAALEVVFGAARSAGVEAHGIWTAAEDERAVASSAGGAALDRTTDAELKVICLAPQGRSGFASSTSTAAGALDAGALAERAAAKATFPGTPAQLPAGDWPVVMEPRAVATMLELLGESALDGLAHAEGRGALAGRLGDLVAAPSVNLADSPQYDMTLPRALDAEGVAKRPLPLIQDGVARGVVHDLRSAALAGAQSTGHALVPGGADDGPRPTNLVLAGGGAASAEELCAPIERGVYVTRLWYENVVRAHETLVTAVTRDGTFLIEDGRVVRPLRDMRLTDRVLGVLSRVQDLGARQELTSAGEFYGRRFASGVVCPPLRASAVRFADAAG